MLCRLQKCKKTIPLQDYDESYFLHFMCKNNDVSLFFCIPQPGHSIGVQPPGHHALKTLCFFQVVLHLLSNTMGFAKQNPYNFRYFVQYSHPKKAKNNKMPASEMLNNQKVSINLFAKSQCYSTCACSTMLVKNFVIPKPSAVSGWL